VPQFATLSDSTASTVVLSAIKSLLQKDTKGLAHKFCVQNSLVIKFYAQNGLAPKLSLQKGLTTRQHNLATKFCVLVTKRWSAGVLGTPFSQERLRRVLRKKTAVIEGSLDMHGQMKSRAGKRQREEED